MTDASVPRRIAAVTAIAILVAACTGGSGSSGPTGSQPGGASGPSGASGPAATADVSGHRPSGAMVRIVNAYAPLNGDPGPIDIYAAPWVDAGATPLVTVPYGTASPFFDPTVADTDGNMSLSVYWKGETGNGNELISQTETLKGGEIITYILTTAESVQDSGRRFGSIHPYYATASGGTVAQPTPNPGKGLLIVDTIGLDNVLTDADTQSWFFSLGQGCARSIDDDPNTLSGVGPGSAATYELDPGTYTGSIHAYPSDSEEIPDCSNAASVGNIAIKITAGATTVSFTYAPKDGDLRTLVLALDK